MRNIWLVILVCVCASIELAKGQSSTPDSLPVATSANETGTVLIEQPIAGRATNDTQQVAVSVLVANRANISATNITRLGTQIYLPSVNPLYALEGRELNVYFRNVVDYPGAWDDVCVSVTCAKGYWFANRWAYTPTAGDAGTNSITLSVLDKRTTNTLVRITNSVITRALAYPVVPVSRKVLIVGDSTGAGPLGELVKLFDGDTNYTLTLVGSNVGNVNDSSGTPRAVACDAAGAWALTTFNSNTNLAWTQINGTNRVGSPFVNPSSGLFDFHYYATNYSVSLSSGDWVIFNLGINDVHYTSVGDATTLSDVAGSYSALTNMIAGVKSEVSGIRIGVTLTIPSTFDQDGWFDKNTSALTANRNRLFWLSRVLAEFDATTVTQVSVIPMNCNLDTVNNFQTQSAVLNARNATTYTQIKDAVHPATSGYFQIADTYRTFLKGKE